MICFKKATRISYIKYWYGFSKDEVVTDRRNSLAPGSICFPAQLTMFCSFLSMFYAQLSIFYSWVSMFNP